jgi:hypothetical protein
MTNQHHHKSVERKTAKPGVTKVAFKSPVTFSVGKRTEKEQLLSRIQLILADHGNIESNIGITHEYWALVNRYRAL